MAVAEVARKRGDADGEAEETRGASELQDRGTAKFDAEDVGAFGVRSRGRTSQRRYAGYAL